MEVEEEVSGYWMFLSIASLGSLKACFSKRSPSLYKIQVGRGNGPPRGGPPRRMTVETPIRINPVRAVEGQEDFGKRGTTSCAPW
jgi:hypothetical protein